MNYIAFFAEMLYYIAMITKNYDNFTSTEHEFAKINSDFHYNLWEYAGKSNSPIHYHNVYELYFLESGSREYIIDGKIYPVEAGMLVIIPPGVLHETTGSSFKRKLMHFSRSALQEVFNKKTVDDLLSVCSSPVYIPNENMPLRNVEMIFQQASIFFARGDFQGGLMSVAYLLNGLRKMTVGEPKSSLQANELIERISLYVQENATKIQNLEEIANTFFISKSHLCHLFKKQKHTTVYDFLLKFKIEKAASLLTTTNKKIKDICEECGFNSEYYFSRRFVMTTGISPSKYRKEFSI